MEISRKLEEIGQAVDSVITQKDLARFLKNPENSQKLNGLVEDIRYALMDYQVRTPKTLARIVSNIRYRLYYNEISTKRAVS